jgi:hypothetical protein
MRKHRRTSHWTGKYPPGSPAEWIADGHVTCCVHCLSGRCDRRMVDLPLARLPLDQPWSEVGWRFVCTACGVAGAVNITPNWHDMKGRAAPFTPGWRAP